MFYNIFVVLSLIWLKIKVAYDFAYQKKSLSGLKLVESTPLSESWDKLEYLKMQDFRLFKAVCLQ